MKVCNPAVCSLECRQFPEAHTVCKHRGSCPNWHSSAGRSQIHTGNLGKQGKPICYKKGIKPLRECVHTMKEALTIHSNSTNGHTAKKSGANKRIAHLHPYTLLQITCYIACNTYRGVL